MKLSHQLEKKLADRIEEDLPKGPQGYVSLPAHEIAVRAARAVMTELRSRLALSEPTEQ